MCVIILVFPGSTIFGFRAIFKIGNGESGNGNGERGIFKSGNL